MSKSQMSKFYSFERFEKSIIVRDRYFKISASKPRADMNDDTNSSR